MEKENLLKKEIWTINDMVNYSGINRQALRHYIYYRYENQMEMPEMVRSYKLRTKFNYSRPGALQIIEWYKNKKWGEMRDYNRKHCYSNSFKEKYPQPKRNKNKNKVEAV